MNRLRRLTAALRKEAEASPGQHFEWLPKQHSFIHSRAKRRLLRSGNQYGKSTAALYVIILHCLGLTTYQAHEPPIEAWVICAGWKQSVAIQKKLWDLVPKRHVSERTTFDPLNGFRGHEKACVFKNGSIIRFRTTGQDTLDLAGATIHIALFDEPPTTQRAYVEVQNRVTRTAGWVLLAMTPVNAPTEWLEAVVEQGGIEDHHARLEPHELIPVGSDRPLCLQDGTPMDEAWIEGKIAETPQYEVPVVIHGEWEQAAAERVFSAFYQEAHVTEELPQGAARISVGFDHGDGADFSEAGYLIAVDDSGEWPRIWVLDEYASVQSTTPEQDAEATVLLLARHGMNWTAVDVAIGDRSYSGKKDRSSKKDNKKLHACIAARMGVPAYRLRPVIQTAKRGVGRGVGSVDVGVRELHHAMVRPGHFHVHPRCKRLIESLEKWDKTKHTEEWKHAIDALRYGLDPWIFRPRDQGPGLRIVR